MARKLDDTEDRTDNTSRGPLFGRRDYVKAGVLSTTAGATIIGSSMTGAAQEPQTIHIAGTGTLATYDVTVSSGLSDAADTSFDASENISGRNAEGTVADDVHGYRFDGELIDIHVVGEAVVYKNGTRLDRSELR